MLASQGRPVPVAVGRIAQREQGMAYAVLALATATRQAYAHAVAHIPDYQGDQAASESWGLRGY